MTGVQAAVALLQQDERPGALALAMLTRLLRNIVNSPQEAKYRRLRLQNPKIKEAVVDAEGGIELLQVRLGPCAASRRLPSAACMCTVKLGWAHGSSSPASLTCAL